MTNPPLLTQSFLIVWVPLLTGFSFGEAADNGFNQALSASLAKYAKGTLGQWTLKVIQNGVHHFIVGMWLLLLTTYYMPSLWAQLLYWFALGLVLSEAKLLAELVKEIENDINQASILFGNQK